MILEAAACYKPPLQSLKVVAEEVLTSTDTLQQAALLLPSLQSLELTADKQYTLSTFQALGQFTTLTKLALSFLDPEDSYNQETPAESLTALSTLHGLKELSIGAYICSSSNLFSIDLLAALSQLTSLTLETGADLEPLALCSNLQSLDVSNSISRWAANQYLSALTQLTQLRISAYCSLAPLTSCSSLANLTIFHVCRTKGLVTLAAALTHLTGLTNLVVQLWAGGPQPNDCLNPDPLRHLPKLQQLDLDVMHDGHLDALSSCTQLSALTAHWRGDDYPAMQVLRPILQPLTSIQSFSFFPEKVPPLHLFPSLVKLTLPWYKGDTSRMQLLQDMVVHCQHLAMLDIFNEEVQPEGLLLLQQLPSLRELDAVVSTKEGLKVLATLTQLTALHLYVHFVDIKPAAARAPAAVGAAAAAAAGGAEAVALAAAAGGAAPAVAAAGAIAGGAAAAALAGGRAAALAVAAAGAAAEGAEARALLALLQLRQKLEYLHLYGWVPDFPLAEAHAFVFG